LPAIAACGEASVQLNLRFAMSLIRYEPHPTAAAGRPLFRSIASFALTPLALCIAQAAAAQTLPTVTVTSEPETAAGPAHGYRAKRSATATKTDTPLHETPQSISVVTRERMEDMGAQNMQDALNYAAGVRSDAYGVDSRGDSFLIRGGFPDEYRDGLRRLFGFYTSNTRTDPYTLERIEVLRGPASMLYGQGSTAGIVNFVTKRPLAEAQREVGVQIGSFNRKQVQADLTGPLDKDGEWLYRLVAVGRTSDTQVDFVPDDRRLIAPSLTWRPNAATSLTLQAHWQQDRSGSTLQFFPWSGSLTPNPNGRIPTSRFVGEPGFDRYDSDRSEFGWLFEHRFNDAWTLRQNLRATRNDVEYRTLYSDAFSNPGNSYIDASQRMLDRFAWSDDTRVRMLATDQHLQGRITTGTVRHDLLIGLDALRFRQSSATAFDGPISQGGTVQPIDVFAPVYNGYTPPAALSPDARTTQRQYGVYLQDQMKIADRWIVVAGLRHDRATSGAEGSPDERSSATTKRLGLMYLAANGLSPYLSYSESFTPVAGTNLAGQRFKPLSGKQLEAGLKYQPAGQDMSFTASVYNLKEHGRPVSDPANPLNQIQAGETRAKGLELEWLGRLGRSFETSAHYRSATT
jgi:iron complex outermembrane receptor protein